MTRKSSIRLADDRELIYFDFDDSPPRLETDERPLPPRAGGSELRFDPIRSEWVAIASHRQTRTFMPPADECPLCPSDPAAGRWSEIPASDYDVVVFENRFPSLTTAAVEPSVSEDPDLWPRMPGTGRCEVVCFSPSHGDSLGSLTPPHAELVMEAWADRTAALSALDGVECVFPFENRGPEMGVTLHHPHGQVYAYPFVPPRVAQMITSASAYRTRTGRNLFDAVVTAELDAKTRVVLESEHWVCFVPAAARWPVEVHLYPRRRVPALDSLSRAERADFAALYLRVLRALDAYYDRPLAYVSGWFQAPVHHFRDEFALHLELFSVRRAPDKLKYVAGSESAMGVWINDLSPEDIASRLRRLLGELP